MFSVPSVSVVPDLLNSQRTGAEAFTSRSHESVTGVNHPATFDGIIVAMDLTESFLDENRPELFLCVDVRENMLGSRGVGG